MIVPAAVVDPTLHTPLATMYLLREQNTAATARADAKGMSQLTCQCQHNDCQNKGL
jgi:hypothetical protein